MGIVERFGGEVGWMDLAGEGEGQRALDGTLISVSGVFEGSEEIAEARDLAAQERAQQAAGLVSAGVVDQQDGDPDALPTGSRPTSKL
ncbi:hypothetical protein ACIBJF_13250 [Streptomyces sp. NPDC050743]|uniref:hypothetical protein n=1 Tax=Streptomyces sp. NPDC050743 TaxID=3365634 RepID=UPI0037973E93